MTIAVATCTTIINMFNTNQSVFLGHGAGRKQEGANFVVLLIPLGSSLSVATSQIDSDN